MLIKNISLSIALIFFASFMFVRCSSDGSEGGGSMKQEARGEVGEIILVMDSAQWKGPLGDALKEVFSPAMEGLPRPEPLFSLKYVNPLRLNSVLRSAKNMIFVTTLNSQSKPSRELRKYFTKESLQRIQSDTNLFMFTKKDDFAKGQEVLHLFGQNEEMLISQLQKSKVKLRDHFNTIERKRLEKELSKGKQNHLTNKMMKERGYSLMVPKGYDLVRSNEEHTWIRFLDPEVDRSLFIATLDYTDEELLNPEKFLDLRNSIMEEQLKDSEKPDIYMTTQTAEGPFASYVNFNGQYGMEARGLWKLSDISGGGPFLSYVFFDEQTKKLYYIEGYVYAPSKDRKAKYMREMEAILWTFKTKSEEEGLDKNATS